MKKTIKDYNLENKRVIIRKKFIVYNLLIINYDD